MGKRIAVGVTLGLACLLVYLASSLVSFGPRPAPGIHAEDCLVDVSVLPTGWSMVSGPHSALSDSHILEDQRARDFATVGFAPPGTEFPWSVTASHVIWDLGNCLHAAVEFYTRFRPDRPTTPEPAQGWSYHSNVADRSRLYCTYARGYPECVATAQYGPFISVFSAPIGLAYGITLEDLEYILTAADMRMARCLGKELPTSSSE